MACIMLCLPTLARVSLPLVCIMLHIYPHWLECSSRDGMHHDHVVSTHSDWGVPPSGMHHAVPTHNDWVSLPLICVMLSQCVYPQWPECPSIWYASCCVYPKWLGCPSFWYASCCAFTQVAGEFLPLVYMHHAVPTHSGWSVPPSRMHLSVSTHSGWSVPPSCMHHAVPTHSGWSVPHSGIHHAVSTHNDGGVPPSRMHHAVPNHDDWSVPRSAGMHHAVPTQWLECPSVWYASWCAFTQVAGVPPSGIHASCCAYPVTGVSFALVCIMLCLHTSGWSSSLWYTCITLCLPPVTGVSLALVCIMLHAFTQVAGVPPSGIHASCCAYPQWLECPSLWYAKIHHGNHSTVDAWYIHFKTKPDIV